LLREIEEYKKELLFYESLEKNREKREVKHEPFTKVMCYGKFLDIVTDREEIERLSLEYVERQRGN